MYNIFLSSKLITFVLLILSLATAGQAQPIAGKVNSKNVLFLSNYQVDLPANTIAVGAIQEEFQKANDITVSLYYEYLDLNRFSDVSYLQALFDLYSRKYRSKPIDLVIVNDKNMLELWLKHRQSILPHTPVIFYDMNTRIYANTILPRDVTGVVSDEDHAKSIRWVLGVRSSIREVVIIHGVGPMDQLFLGDTDNVKTALGARVKFSDWSNLSMTEMKSRAAILPKTSVILYSLLFEDATGVRYRPIDALRELAKVSSVPILSGYDQFIGTGTIGGYMYSIEQQARQASRMGLRILRGEPVSAVPVIKNRGTQFIFDHRALQRWDLPLSVLPHESIIKHRQYSVWERYHMQIMAVIAAMIILILLLISMAILVQKLNKTRLALSKLNINLEAQVKERTSTLTQTNQRLATEVSERILAETEQARLIDELQNALVQIKRLSGLLPICASCKKIRDDKGYWNQLELYIRDHSEAEFSHGICPDCAKKLYPEIFK